MYDRWKYDRETKQHHYFPDRRQRSACGESYAGYHNPPALTNDVTCQACARLALDSIEAAEEVAAASIGN